jgi:hypothetical protein
LRRFDRRDGGVPEGSLHQMNGRTVFQSVGSVGVPEPVRGNLLLQSSCLSRSVDDAADLGNVERPPLRLGKMGSTAWASPRMERSWSQTQKDRL